MVGVTNLSCAVETRCINISCDNILTIYEFTRQSKSKKYRFCRKCRNSKTRNNSMWKCVTCDTLMNYTNTMFGKLYCDDRCKNRHNSRLGYNRNHSRVLKIAKKLKEKVGTQRK